MPLDEADKHEIAQMIGRAVVAAIPARYESRPPGLSDDRTVISPGAITPTVDRDVVERAALTPGWQEIQPILGLEVDTFMSGGLGATASVVHRAYIYGLVGGSVLQLNCLFPPNRPELLEALLHIRHHPYLLESASVRWLESDDEPMLSSVTAGAGYPTGAGV